MPNFSFLGCLEVAVLWLETNLVILCQLKVPPMETATLSTQIFMQTPPWDVVSPRCEHGVECRPQPGTRRMKNGLTTSDEFGVDIQPATATNIAVQQVSQSCASLSVTAWLLHYISKGDSLSEILFSQFLS
jgi:hypothetical protein